MKQVNRSIEPASERHVLLRYRAHLIGGKDLQCLRFVLDGHVLTYNAVLFEAKDVWEIEMRCWPVNVFQPVGPGESGVVLLEILLIEKRICFFHR